MVELICYATAVILVMAVVAFRGSQNLVDLVVGMTCMASAVLSLSVSPGFLLLWMIAIMFAIFAYAVNPKLQDVACNVHLKVEDNDDSSS